MRPSRPMPTEEVRTLFTEGCLQHHRPRPGQDVASVRRAYAAAFDSWLAEIVQASRDEGRRAAERHLARDGWISWATALPPSEDTTR
ncbi:hypothetical protein GCM10010467_15540 [Actinocorallia glomerata]|uniref:Uncharacterized protein n=3 Tax=Actinomycetota TaxID=201174 RepID=A0ABP6LRK8_9MICC